MARRGTLNKYFKPEEPEPEPESQAPEQGTPQPQAAKKPERGVMFGTPEDRKKIAISAAVGVGIASLVFALVAKHETPFPVIPLIFVALHGGLLGMLMAQLVLVFADRVIVIATLLGAIMAEAIYFFATGKYENFVLDRQTLQELIMLFFWGAFVGFWVGFINYVKRRMAHRRFQQRYGGSGADRDIL